jgi:hypothetical protein
MALQYVQKVSTYRQEALPTPTHRYPTPHQQHEIPPIPALVITKVPLPQYIMAAFVNSHSNLFPDVTPGLPTYKMMR